MGCYCGIEILKANDKFIGYHLDALFYKTAQASPSCYSERVGNGSRSISAICQPIQETANFWTN